MIPEGQARAERSIAITNHEAAVLALARLRADQEEVVAAKAKLQVIIDSVAEVRAYLVGNDDFEPECWKGEACRVAYLLWHELAYSTSVGYLEGLDGLADDLKAKQKTLDGQISDQEGKVLRHKVRIDELDRIIRWWMGHPGGGD